MNIEKAKLLKIGDIVHCPADRGDPAYSGRVTHVSEAVNKAYGGSEYIWITVQQSSKQSAVWPSNRLG